MEQRKSFLLRVDPETWRAIEAWAEQEMRSVNGQIEYILKQAVSRRRRPAAEGEGSGPERGGKSAKEKR